MSTATSSPSSTHTTFLPLLHKPFIGGYKNKLTGKEYVHGFSQTVTALERRRMLSREKFHRDVQTKFWRNRLVQSTTSKATQIAKKGLLQDDSKDRVILSKPYVTADEKNETLIKKVIIIQCFFRKILAIKRVRAFREMHAKKKAEFKEKEETKEKKMEEARQREIERRVHPQTARDFSILYSGLEAWREDATKSICTTEPDSEKRREKLKSLVNQEASLIRQICMLKKQAFEDHHQRAIDKWVDKIASPKRWRFSTHGVILVDTPSTLRARQLSSLYHELKEPSTSVDQRLHILLQVKNTVKVYDCALVSELIQLINREGDLLCRGRDGECLDGLRLRIANLFFQFLSEPQFNPEAETGKLKPKPTDSVYICKSCERYLPSTHFLFSTTESTLGLCHSCRMYLNESSTRKSTEVYAFMLASIRLNELKITSEINWVVRYLTEMDIQYLVETIWHGQSSISGCRDVNQLTLIRFHPHQWFSPWNAMLVTLNEAQTHATIHSTSLYSPLFLQSVERKLSLAKQHWFKLYQLTETVKENPHLQTRLRSQWNKGKEWIESKS